MWIFMVFCESFGGIIYFKNWKTPYFPATSKTWGHFDQKFEKCKLLVLVACEQNFYSRVALIWDRAEIYLLPFPSPFPSLLVFTAIVCVLYLLS